MGNHLLFLMLLLKQKLQHLKNELKLFHAHSELNTEYEIYPEQNNDHKIFELKHEINILKTTETNHFFKQITKIPSDFESYFHKAEEKKNIQSFNILCKC